MTHGPGTEEYQAVFTGKTLERLQEMLGRYPAKQAALLPALWLVQEQRGWISDRNMAEVGEVLGLTFQQIQKYESGKNRMAYSTVVMLAHYFGQSIDQFLVGLDDFSPADSENQQTTGPMRAIPLLADRCVQELVLNYATLSPQEQQAVADFVRKMSSDQDSLAA